MLSKLRKWFRSHALNPAARFAAGRPRFRGQFEQLEARTVLSASFGPLPVNFEIGYSGAWESPFTEIVGPSYPSASAVTTPHWEDSPALPLSDAHDFAGPLDSGRSAPPYGGLRDELVDRPASSGYVITVYISVGARSMYQSPLAHLDGKPDSKPIAKPPLAGMSPFPNWRQYDWQPNPRNIPQMSIAPADPFSRLLVMSSDSSDEADRSSKAAVRGRDSAFQSYSNESLLLATTSDESYDADFYRTADDLRNTSDQDAAFTALHESALDGDELSLDALQHERKALEAVFAILSVPEGRPREPDEDDAEEQQPANTKPRHDGNDEAFVPETIYAAATRHDLTHGGMVLLEPAGDSNVSAYDLIQVIAGTKETPIDMPLGVEASIGIYHAFDIGTADSRPTTNDAAPLSTRPDAGPSNASAEVAPAKRSEQAS